MKKEQRRLGMTVETDGRGQRVSKRAGANSRKGNSQGGYIWVGPKTFLGGDGSYCEAEN